MHEHQHQPSSEEPRKPFWKTPLGWAFIGFAAIAAFFLITEHTAHTITFLPWLLLLACPLIHIFGHGHGGHDGHSQQDQSEPKESKDAGPRDETKSAHRH